MRPLIAFRRTPPGKTVRRRRISLMKAATRAAIATPWVVLAALLGGAVWLVWAEGGPGSLAARARAEAITASLRLGFEIDEVWVDGLVRSRRPDVLMAVGAYRGDAMLEFDPAAARARLLELPWIKDAIVARALPSQVQVTLIERAPLALWQRKGRLAVIDRDGRVIDGVDPGAFADLPILVGKGADREGAGLLKLVAAEPAIARRLTAAVFIGERRWDIRIDDRIEVRLPADQPATALARLSRLEQEHRLFEKDIVAIDLRLTDRLVVRLAPGAAVATAAVGRES